MSDKIKVQLMRATDALKQPHTSESSLVTPALLETFSRVLLWSGTKNFQCMFKMFRLYFQVYIITAVKQLNN